MSCPIKTSPLDCPSVRAPNIAYIRHCMLIQSPSPESPIRSLFTSSYILCRSSNTCDLTELNSPLNTITALLQPKNTTEGGGKLCSIVKYRMNSNFGRCKWHLCSPAESYRGDAQCTSSISTLRVEREPTCWEFAGDSSRYAACSRLLGIFKGEFQPAYCLMVINEPQGLGTVWLGCVLHTAKWARMLFIIAVKCFVTAPNDR